jgi:hypothetical protein
MKTQLTRNHQRLGRRPLVLLALLAAALHAGLVFGTVRGREFVRGIASTGVTTTVAQQDSNATKPQAESRQSAAPAAPAQPSGTIEMTRSVLPGGGDFSTGGNFQLGGSIGQSVVGPATGGAFSLASGFWDEASAPCPAITIAPATLASGVGGTPYNQTFTASGGTGPYNFTVATGTLPAGITLDVTGLLSGTPTMMGAFNFTIKATDAKGCAVTQPYTLTINNCPTVTLGALPQGAVSVSYNQTIAVTPAAPAGSYTFTLSQGSLPPGLGLNPGTGVVSGMATVTGAYSFSVKAATANGCSGIQAYTLVIVCPNIVVNPANLPSGAVGTAYSQTLSASPAGGSYNFAVTSGSLPQGVSLNTATGVLSGTPSSNGTSNFTIAATGWGNCSGSRAYTITVGNGCPAITLPDLPGGAIGQSYSNSVAASPSGVYSYVVTSGSLPAGLTLYDSAGLIYGYPTAAGTFTFAIKATGSNGCMQTRSYSVTIGGAGLARAVFGDFDGDGRTDFSVWRGMQSDWLIVKSSSGRLQSLQWGAAYDPYNDVIAPGDYDGDGKFDVAVFRRGIQKGQGGEWLIKCSKDGSTITQAWGLATDTPVPADYDGDGQTDIAVWRGAETRWYIQRSSDHQVQIVSWGTSNAPYRDVPVPADYDGDGKTDIAVFRQANGHWYIKLSSDGSVIDKAWGLGSDVPVAADYDGDGKADFAVWRGADTNWYIFLSGRSSDGQTQIVSWGASSLGDVPVPGDYDGDGKADVSIWRPSEGTWYIRNSGDDSVTTKAHGQQGDAPVAGKR